MINGKPFKKNYLLLALCIIGVGLVAWWAWAAGPVQTKKSSLGTSPEASAIYKLNDKTLHTPTASGSLSPSLTTASNSSQAAGASPTSSPQTNPVDSQPSYPDCMLTGGAQADALFYPCGCNYSPNSAYPCCQSSSAHVCGCGVNKAELCPMPLY